jgi:hypothetical protein
MAIKMEPFSCKNKILSNVLIMQAYQELDFNKKKSWLDLENTDKYFISVRISIIKSGYYSFTTHIVKTI